MLDFATLCFLQLSKIKHYKETLFIDDFQPLPL